MKKAYLYLPIYLLLFPLTTTSSCQGQVDHPPTKSHYAPDLELFPNFNTQIGEYLIEIFEDSKGNLWIGTLAKGVARYNGETLTYFTTADGLAGNAVVNIVEDQEGNIWFGTHSGLSKYDGQGFTNYTRTGGVENNRISNLLIDNKGLFWVGTWGGVCQFDGTAFIDFPIPKPEIELRLYQTTMNWITEIMEDQHGNIWFGRDGYGACKYDGRAFTHFTKKDGLPSNNVQAIMEDRQGDIWFGTRVTEKDHPFAGERSGAGGLARYDGKTISQFPDIEGLNRNDIYCIYEDNAGTIWVSAPRVGLYTYKDESFSLYRETDRMDLTQSITVQGILQDTDGVLWLGFNGGLFRLQDSSLINVTTRGPWK